MLTTDIISSASVQILDNSKKSLGTGFFVDQHLVLTCAHVITSSFEPPTSLFQIRLANNNLLSAYVLPNFWRPIKDGDIAILKVDSITQEHPKLNFSLSKNAIGKKFLAFGFPQIPQLNGIWATGNVIDFITDSDNQNLVQLRSPELSQGMSGCPIVDSENLTVIGMLCAVYHPAQDTKLRDTAFAIPTETVKSVCPNITLVESQRVVLQDAWGLLANQMFSEAYVSLTDFSKTAPSDSEANLLLAFALIGTRSIDTLKKTEIQRIENHLRVAQKSSQLYALALALLIIIKHDFFVINGLSEGEPSLKNLLEQLKDTCFSPKENSLLSNLRITLKVKKLLKLT